MGKHRHARVALTVVLLLVTHAANAGSAGTGRFVETVRVVSVDVPVQVTVDGAPVRGLTVGDFALFDGGKPQRIDRLEVVDLSLIGPGEAGAATPELWAAGRRRFLVLFDLCFSDPAAVFRARRAVRDSLLGAVHPTDLVAVAAYGCARGPELILNFTSDRVQAAVAIDSLGLPQLVDRSTDPLALQVGAPRFASLEESPSFRQLDGSPLPDDENSIRNAFREVYYGAYEPLRMRAERQGVHAFTKNLSALARLMAGVHGRKYVVYLSEGFDASLVFSTEDRSEMEFMNDSLERGRLWRVEPDKRFGSSTSQALLGAMIEAFRRADCTIHAVDVGGSEGLGSAADGLRLMAQETGGEVYRNFDSFAEAMASLLERTSVTYVLSFRPAESKREGEYRRLKVVLTGGRRDAKVVHRPGYHAPGARSADRGVERQLSRGQRIIEGREGGGIATSVLAVPFRSGNGGAYVPALIEIDGPGLLEGHRGPSLPVEIYGYAFDAHGRLADFFAHTAAVDLAGTADRLRASGLKFFGELHVSPGEYSLRVLVLNPTTGAFGMRSASVGVPRFEAGDPALLPPLFPEPRGRWVLARERGADREPEPFPFLYGQEPYLPSARPAIPPGRELPFYLTTYHMSRGRVSIEGRLLSIDGREVLRRALPVFQGRAPEPPGLATLESSLAVDGIEGGDYRFVVTATDEGSGQSRSSSIVISVPAAGQEAR